MAKVQNKLMAKIEMIEQSSKNLTVRLDSCREDVTLLMDYAKEVLERLIRARFKYQQEDIFLGPCVTLDHISNVFVLIIASIGAGVQEEEADCQPGAITDGDTIIVREVRRKLKELTIFGQTLQKTCQSMCLEIYQITELVSKYRQDSRHDDIQDIFMELSKHEGKLNDMAILVLGMESKLRNTDLKIEEIDPEDVEVDHEDKEVDPEGGVVDPEDAEDDPEAADPEESQRNGSKELEDIEQSMNNLVVSRLDQISTKAVREGFS